MTQAGTPLQLLAERLPLERRPWQEGFGESPDPQAAVLVALTDEVAPKVLLGRRAAHLALHPGEVAFAGGKREAEDNSPWHTALREAQEEVGLTPESCRPLGELSPLLTRTGFQVYPCIGAVPKGLDIVLDPGEFDSVFMPQLAVFARPELFELQTLTAGKHTRTVPSYRIEGDHIWGVTAAILAQLVNVAYDAGFDLQRDWNVKP